MSVPLPITFLVEPSTLSQLPDVANESSEPAKRENRLERLARIANEEQEEQEQTLLDLTIPEIFDNTLQTVQNVIEDLLDNPFSLRMFIGIISEGDRLIYLGIFLMILAVLLYMVGIAN